jgi:hypothetical protein
VREVGKQRSVGCAVLFDGLAAGDASVGELAGQDADEDEYQCEVSCADWYGNARPIFVAGRVFALTGVELIEGEIRDGAMVEIGRLRMTAAPVNP